MIGDHTWSHPSMPGLSAGAQRQQLLSTASAIQRATHGFTPCLWRPPYGAVNGPLVSLARSLGLLTIMWDVDPRDWATPGVGAIYGNVVANVRNGAIVLQHFGGGPRYQTLAALPQEIDTLRHRGYQFVTVAQMLGLRLIYK
jgi:peptidoglycan/xylan/chitin deacetylase (PgdA/CDA1 family)